MSRKRTSRALRWMNERRDSTSSPIRTLNISSAWAASHPGGAGGAVVGRLEQHAPVRVHGGVPQLRGVDLARALEPRHEVAGAGVLLARGHPAPDRLAPLPVGEDVVGVAAGLVPLD